MERCYGCNAEAGEHPILGIINKADVEDGAPVIANPNATSAFVGVGVCADCHRDPEHRTVRALKCHFHERANAGKALVGLIMAGSTNLQS